MIYDVIFVIGEKFFDHPLCGIAILKRLLEKNNYKVGVIEIPKTEHDIKKLGEPRLFFGVSSGSIDSMLRNYSALNRRRALDKNIDYKEDVPDRAIIVYSNWIRHAFKTSAIVIGGVESSLRRFTHYDYWSNKLRKSIIFDSRADILVYGSGEKQCLEIADRIKNNKRLDGIEGTCIKSRQIPEDFTEMPGHEQVSESKEKFCDMQNLLDNNKNLAQKTDNFYILQYKFPVYTSKDLDEYYELPFTRKINNVDYMKGFEFSVVTHRGCIGNCNFCSLRLMFGDRVISRSEESIIREIKYITTLPHFKGNIDDLGGPTANMYGMDCNKCKSNCISCAQLNRSHSRLIKLLRDIRNIKGIKKVFIRSGIRYDIAPNEYLKELKHHISGQLKIAPEHVSSNVLDLMNKNKGDLDEFIRRFERLGCGELSFYFMVGHPGTSMKEAKDLALRIKQLKNVSAVQIFTPTPMTVSTCMYYTGLNPRTKKPVYIPHSYQEKKEQKRILGLKPRR